MVKGSVGRLTRRPVKFKLHIDHLDNANGDVWAVSLGKRYLTVSTVICKVPVQTVFKGPKARQPKAYLTGHGIIWVSDDRRTVVIS